jgi:hypothetical protein
MKVDLKEKKGMSKDSSLSEESKSLQEFPPTRIHVWMERSLLKLDPSLFHKSIFSVRKRLETLPILSNRQCQLKIARVNLYRVCRANSRKNSKDFVCNILTAILSKLADWRERVFVRLRILTWTSRQSRVQPEVRVTKEWL